MDQRHGEEPAASQFVDREESFSRARSFVEHKKRGTEREERKGKKGIE